MSIRPTKLFASYRRFLADAPPDDFRDRYIAALNDNAFREPLTDTHKERRIGWAVVSDPLVTDFNDINLWLFNNYAVFCLRGESKKISPKFFAAHLRKRVKTWCQANNRERCPAKVKAELKEQLEMEMLLKTLPTPDYTGVAWNIAEGWVVFGGTSATRVDEFRKLFHRTFGITLRPADPLDALTEDVGCALLDATPMDIRPAPGVPLPAGPVEAPESVDGEDDAHDGAFDASEEELTCPAHIASEFLLYLWWRSATGRGEVQTEHGAISFYLDGRIDFRRPGEDKTVVGVTLDEPSATSVALAALASGAVVKSAGLTICREDRSYTLRLSGALLHRSGVKLPALVKDGDDAEMLYEAAFLHEELEFVLGQLFATYARQRSASGWTVQGGRALMRWLGASLGQEFHFDGAGQGWLFGASS